MKLHLPALVHKATHASKWATIEKWSERRINAVWNLRHLSSTDYRWCERNWKWFRLLSSELSFVCWTWIYWGNWWHQVGSWKTICTYKRRMWSLYLEAYLVTSQNSKLKNNWLTIKNWRVANLNLLTFRWKRIYFFCLFVLYYCRWLIKIC